MSRADDKNKPLTIREYIGAFLPPRSERAESRKDEPLTAREYLGAMPNLFEIVQMVGDGAKAAGRGVQRIWRNVVRK